MQIDYITARVHLKRLTQCHIKTLKLQARSAILRCKTCQITQRWNFWTATRGPWEITKQIWYALELSNANLDLITDISVPFIWFTALKYDGVAKCGNTAGVLSEMNSCLGLTSQKWRQMVTNDEGFRACTRLFCARIWVNERRMYEKVNARLTREFVSRDDYEVEKTVRDIF